MLFTLLSLGLVAVLVTGAVLASSPATQRSRTRDTARRRRYVERHPTEVNYLDLVELLVRGGMRREQAHFVTRKAADNGIRPLTLWLWLDQFDADALSIVVAADLTHEQLLTHLSQATAPDLDMLGIFAAANGLEPVTSTSKPAVRARATVGVAAAAPATATTSMPQVFEPGWGFGGGVAPAGLDDERPGDVAA